MALQTDSRFREKLLSRSELRQRCTGICSYGQRRRNASTIKENQLNLHWHLLSTFKQHSCMEQIAYYIVGGIIPLAEQQRQF
jgi:hypothetical protein